MSEERSISSTALAVPSLDYLLGCSENALHDLELTAFNRAASCLVARGSNGKRLSHSARPLA